MNIAFYDTKPYDRIWFDVYSKEMGFPIKFFEDRLTTDTAILSRGCDVACVFVNDRVDAKIIDALLDQGIKLLALRSAGYNNVDLQAAFGKLPIVRVPNYSPCAVAEHAIALLLSVNRKTHRAYVRTRDNNFSINGLMGTDLCGKTVGVVGTGRIGKIFASVMRGFGTKVVAYDVYPDYKSGLDYVSLDELCEVSDVISLHCPLTPETFHMINADTIGKMKDTAILINTSRGALIDTDALLEGLKNRELGGAGLDVYEEEEEYFFEDRSNDIIADDDLARLLSFPNVLITSHQAFFTREAMQEIARVTMGNIAAFRKGEALKNEVVWQP